MRALSYDQGSEETWSRHEVVRSILLIHFLYRSIPIKHKNSPAISDKRLGLARGENKLKSYKLNDSNRTASKSERHIWGKGRKKQTVKRMELWILIFCLVFDLAIFLRTCSIAWTKERKKNEGWTEQRKNSERFKINETIKDSRLEVRCRANNVWGCFPEQIGVIVFTVVTFSDTVPLGNVFIISKKKLEQFSLRLLSVYFSSFEVQERCYCLASFD